MTDDNDDGDGDGHDDGDECGEYDGDNDKSDGKGKLGISGWDHIPCTIA